MPRAPDWSLAPRLRAALVVQLFCKAHCRSTPNVDFLFMVEIVISEISFGFS